MGHLKIADRIRRLFDLAQVHFVVAAEPPHKSSRGLAPLIHRFAMVSLATAGNPAFLPSLIEMENPPSPFSLDTLRKLARRHRLKATDLYFIAGGDSLLEVMGWHQGEELLRSYNFIFVARPGVAARNAADLFPAGIRERIRDLRVVQANQVARRIRIECRRGETRIFIVDAGAPDISSSMVRNLASAGKSIRHLVPVSVHQYIHKLHLYGER